MDNRIRRERGVMSAGPHCPTIIIVGGRFDGLHAAKALSNGAVDVTVWETGVSLRRCTRRSAQRPTAQGECSSNRTWASPDNVTSL
ncbi:MAG: hypothetical protein OJF47_002931 [Nitrospira sp.]|nr:MAG: hypothetical protein OJF47_002931 [Nitrospira sp.]